ncbi:hypothetical protein Scep_003605 [Stephania cephalantha]|uniref:Uncharacterized protein n=1 Tax=Stephania cephalantha TaxID=152367 RepID=A0AAP0PY77_9MAGN
MGGKHGSCVGNMGTIASSIPCYFPCNACCYVGFLYYSLINSILSFLFIPQPFEVQAKQTLSHYL